nr:hypothetical protein [Tanacetum cinerariifolium]
MELSMQNKEHGRMILESVENGPFIWHTVEENGVIKTKKYAELSAVEKIQADCDINATNIIFQDVKIVKDLHTTNFDQLRAYLEQHELHANEVHLLCERKQDPLAFVVNQVTVQQVYGRQGQSYSSTGYKCNATSSGGNNASGQARVVKCYNYQGEGHMARKCTQPKRSRNATWYKKKAMLADAQKAGQILDEEQLVFLKDPRVPDEVPHSKTYLNDMENQEPGLEKDVEKDEEVVVMDDELQGRLNLEEVNVASKEVSDISAPELVSAAEPTVFDDEDVTMKMA